MGVPLLPIVCLQGILSHKRVFLQDEHLLWTKREHVKDEQNVPGTGSDTHSGLVGSTLWWGLS